MKTTRFSETLTSTNQPTRRLNPKEHHQNCHSRENLESHNIASFYLERKQSIYPEKWMISAPLAQYTRGKGHTHLDYRISEWTRTAINLWHFQMSSYALCSFNSRSSKKAEHHCALFSFWMPWNLKPIALCSIGARSKKKSLWFRRSSS
jgi:hypothetical protein